VKSLAPKLILLAVSLALGIALIEAGLRIQVGPPAIYRFPQESYAHDPVMGHKLVPGDRAFTHDRPVSINSAGIRGPEYTRAVPPGTRRILAMGDSQTFGNGLDREEAWPALLEARLADADPGRRWEVLNAGISGTDTWQHAEWLRQLSAHYDFDAVVLAFYVNDVTPRYRPQPAAQITNTFTKRVGYWLKRSALFTLVWQLWKQRGAAAKVALHEQHILNGEPDEAVARGWRQVEESLAEMKSLCDELGVPLVLVVIPRRDQVDGSEPGTDYDRRISEIAGTLGIPSVDALTPLRESYAVHGRSLFIPWDGHNTGLANRVVAETTLEAHRGILLDRPPLSRPPSDRTRKDRGDGRPAPESDGT
jgi:hypothetical protein